MEWWINQQTREVILAEPGRICYDLTWVCLGKWNGLFEDYDTLRKIGGWFKV